MEVPVPDIIVTWQFWVTGVAVYILCEIFKQIPSIKDGGWGWVVNIASVFFGSIILCLLLGFTWENLVFGILAAAASTLAYEIWSNVLNSIEVAKQFKPLPASNDADADDKKVGGSD